MGGRRAAELFPKHPFREPDGTVREIAQGDRTLLTAPIEAANPEPQNPVSTVRRPEPGAGHVLLSAAPLESSAAQAHLADLMSLSDPTLSELSLEALLNEVLVRIRVALSVDTVAVLLLDRETDELVARAAKGLEAEVERGVRVPLGRGFAGRIAADRRPIAIPDLTRADVVNPILHEMGLCSMLGVPLIVEADLIGVLHVGSLTPRNFSAVDAAVLELAAGRVAPGIERARLLDQLGQERLAAETLQRGLLPDTVPPLGDVDVAVRYVPARSEVGGDWYDVIALDHARVGIAIGDVVGHGVRAAALMSQMRAAMRAYALLDPDPASVLTNLDRYLQHSSPNGMATVAYAVLDTTTGALEYASAGHPPAILVDEIEARTLEAPTRPPLGVQHFSRFPTTVMSLPVGTTMLVYTDGLIERRGESLSVGIERLCQAAIGLRSPELLCARVVQQLLGPVAAEDDVALVAVRRPETPETLELRLAAERATLASLRQRLTSWLRGHEVREDDARAIVLAVSEAAANAIEHAYAPRHASYHVHAHLEGDFVVVTVTDRGQWRDATPSENRGRGLGIMERTMDSVDIERSEQGTRIVLRRRRGGER
jgi:anti-sigma regulatory factor (Ser/Thr protein kinase)/putative methionine-R-sulfoxide reductase with GAF domain